MFIKTKYKEISTVKDIMPFFRGNQSEAARHLKVNRASLRKYLVINPYVFIERDATGEPVAFSIINSRDQFNVTK